MASWVVSTFKNDDSREAKIGFPPVDSIPRLADDLKGEVSREPWNGVVAKSRDLRGDESRDPWSAVETKSRGESEGVVGVSGEVGDLGEALLELGALVVVFRCWVKWAELSLVRSRDDRAGWEENSM